jgi:hypothetical protein
MEVSYSTQRAVGRLGSDLGHDRRRLSTSVEPSAGRRCVDCRYIRVGPDDSAPSGCCRRRRACRVGHREVGGIRPDQPTKRLESDPPRQQHPGVPVVDAGALRQGRPRRGAGELQLDVGVIGIRNGCGLRLQGRRHLGTRGFTQRRVHDGESIDRRSLGHDDGAG